MISQSNYLYGIRPNEGSHLTSIVPPYELLMMRTPEPEMLRTGKVPTSLLKQRKIQRTELKLPILQWFTALTAEQRKRVTEIQDDVIVEMSVRLSGLINLERIKVSVDFNQTRNEASLEERFKIRTFASRNIATPKTEAERILIESLRIICIGRPALYLSSTFLEDPVRYFDCLSQISEGQIFKLQNSQSNGGRLTNSLWFSYHSFNSLGQWVCSSLEQVMIQKYQNWVRQSKGFKTLDSESSALGFVQEFSKFCKKNSEGGAEKGEDYRLQKWLELKIKDSNFAEITQIRNKFQQLEISFNEEKTNQFFDNIDTLAASTKKPKKACKKKKPQKKLVQTFKEEEVQVGEAQEEIEENPPQLVKNHSEAELKEIIETLSADISTISQMTVNQIEPIKIQSQEIHFPEGKAQQVQEEQLLVEEIISQQKIQLAPNEHALSHSTSDSLEQKKKRKHHVNKRSRRRIPQELIEHIYSQWFETSLQSFVDNLSIQSNQLFEARIIVFQRIRHFVMKLHGEYTVDARLFGSCSVGLALPTSDIDILLTGFNLQTQADCAQLLEKLSTQLKKMKWIVQCSIYPSAKVPIIKVSVNPNTPFFSTYFPQSEDFQKLKAISESLELSKPVNQIISIDITIEVKKAQYGHLGFKSTEFMKTHLEDIEYLHPIVLTLKYLLAQKKLNKPYKGGLNSFGLLILCAAYLKNYPQHQSLSEAFLNLLDFYGNIFDGDKQSITLYPNCPCFSDRPLNECVTDGGLSIIDPLSGRVMTANCTGYYTIKYEFRRSFAAIVKVKQALKAELKQMEINEFKSLKEGKKKPRDKLIRKYLQHYQVKEILTQE